MSKISLNDQWSFSEKNDAAVTTVRLPHTVKLENLHVYRNKQGIFVYKKKIYAPENFSGVAFIEFEGVMTNCTVFINGKKMMSHYGGYLPFLVDITQFFEQKHNITVEVEVDNHDDKNTPPGKATSRLDFLYYGGIYRNVNLILKPNAHITHPFEKADGGIKLIAEPQKDGRWSLCTMVNITASNIKESFVVKATILEEEKEIYALSINETFAVGQNKTVILELKDLNVISWEILNAKLYNIKIDLIDNANNILDTEIIQYGLRKAEITRDGFLINGQLVRLIGTNRHQQYPYIGIAASDEAQRREARLFGKMKINCLRLAHYPQSPAFLSECDKLGIVLIDCVPGWQFLGGRTWKKRLKENVIDMVKRDRNHPSVVFYEVTPNETMYPIKRGDKFIKSLADAVKEMLPSALTAGDTAGRRDAEFVGLDVPYTGEDRLEKKRKLYANGEKKFFRREYGDWSFGGNNSTSRATHSEGELALQIQAWNFQWTHNVNYESSILGDLTWEGIDHNRGYCPKYPISTSGIFDIFRLPKLTYGLLASQANPELTKKYVIFPAFLTINGKRKLTVYSNCHQMELKINGDTIAKKNADSGETKLYDKTKNKEIDEYYWATADDENTTSDKVCMLAKHTKNCLFDGGNCKNMLYPPFTFTDINIVSGDVAEFLGYNALGEEVQKIKLRDHLAANCLNIEVRDCGIKLKANGNDFVFLSVYAVDNNGKVDLDYQKEVSIEIKGGKAIYTYKMVAEKGVASFLVTADEGVDMLEITANSDNLLQKIVYSLN